MFFDNGAGHNADMQHSGSNNGYDDQGNYQISGAFVPGGLNIMTDGGIVAGNIQKNNGSLQTYITTPMNQQPANNAEHTISIKQAFIHRFGNNTPNAKLPTIP